MMKKTLSSLLLLALTAVLLSACGGSPDSSGPETESPAEPSAEPVKEPGEMRDITTMELTHEMGIGVNLGNTMEAIGGERAWGSPPVTEQMITGYANAGFKSVRIPVAWSQQMEEDGYIIYTDRMDRVQQIVDWTLDNGMIALINIHWDGGWWEDFPADKDRCMAKYKAIWTQISERFKDYGDTLIFESANEELGWDSLWNRWGGSANGKAEYYGLVNEINQIFVDLVRASGGNNDRRHLLIAGPVTDVDLTCDPMFEMPSDPQNRCAVSVHYYTPSTFAILEQDASWGKMRDSWGTDADFAELNRLMDKVKTTFIDKGVPVIVGEFGAERKNKQPGMVHLYINSVCEAIYTRGMVPMLWDTPGSNFYDRLLYTLDPVLGEAFAEIAKLPR
ncbi:MAG: glycoside hydrolase family 5 protein [Oscillospiraceae bacterium]|jgi:endoglucanase|nr:glycoside hydrolase family 5 protein [Oscillospiraceae bacterium]